MIFLSILDYETCTTRIFLFDLIKEISPVMSMMIIDVIDDIKSLKLVPSD